MTTSTDWSAATILGVRRVRPAAEYFRDALGFALDPRHGVFAPSPDEPDGVYALLERAGVRVHLQIRRDAPPPRPRAALERDLYVYVSAVDALHAELVERGARVVAPPAWGASGLREFVVEDLDGHRLAFGERA